MVKKMDCGKRTDRYFVDVHGFGKESEETGSYIVRKKMVGLCGTLTAQCHFNVMVVEEYEED